MLSNVSSPTAPYATTLHVHLFPDVVLEYSQVFHVHCHHKRGLYLKPSLLEFSRVSAPTLDITAKRTAQEVALPLLNRHPPTICEVGCWSELTELSQEYTNYPIELPDFLLPLQQVEDIISFHPFPLIFPSRQTPSS